MKLDRVMVCWDGSRAAARAVADAMPFLKKAKAGRGRHRRQQAGKIDEVPGADLGQHLARHGLKVDVKRITSPDIDVALHDPFLCRGFLRRHDRDGRLRPLAPARIRPRRRDPRPARGDDGSGADVALNLSSRRVSVCVGPGIPCLRNVHVTTLRDGREGRCIRPLKPEDAALYPDLPAEVTPEDLRLRFFAPMREVSHELDRQAHPLRSGTRHGLHRHRRGERRCSAWCACTTIPTAKAANSPSCALAAQGSRAGLADDEAHDRLRPGAAASKPCTARCWPITPRC